MQELNKDENRKYHFSTYDPAWVTRFNQIKDFLLKVFGPKALEVEHVGSTSVEGMKAKPIIDALVIVETIKNLEKQKQMMIEAGYEWNENYLAPNTYLFYKLGSEGEKVENIHVCEKDSPKVRQFIVMRDYLRAHPDKAEEYSNLKQKNRDLYPDDYPEYRKAKTAFLNQLEQEAYEWEQ